MKNSKKLCFLALFVTFCVILLSCASSGGSAAVKQDDGPGTPTLATGEWMTYSDVAGGNNGSSTVKLVTAKEVINGKESVVYHVTGNVTTKYQYGFAGWGLNADEATLNLYKTAKKFSFWILGDGLKYTIKFKLSSIKDFGDYEYSFNTEKGVPLLIEVPIKFFMQSSWAQSVKMNQSLVTGIEGQTHESWRKTPNNNPFDIKMWDFTVYN
jgi:hypothetical protein